MCKYPNYRFNDQIYIFSAFGKYPLLDSPFSIKRLIDLNLGKIKHQMLSFSIYYHYFCTQILKH
jgi:hypothetical protein